MQQKKAIIIGAGMAGLAAAINLLEQGFYCTVIEAQHQAGGLAGFFTVEGKNFPIGYHHILYRDKPLLSMLKKMGLYEYVAWKKAKVLFTVNNEIYSLTNPVDFIRFPISWQDKLRFVYFMANCFIKNDWESLTLDARTWLDAAASPKVREIIFDPLVDIKYGVGSEHLSASWLGSRLHYQEFSKPLGYIPGVDWTSIFVDKLVNRCREIGGHIILGSEVKKVAFSYNTFQGVTYIYNGNPRQMEADILVNTAPPHIFLNFCAFQDKTLADITYLDALSLIVETEQKLPAAQYLLACLSPRYSFGGIFTLSSLNPAIGAHQGAVLNFFTTLSPRYEYLRHKTAAELLEIYQQDFEKIFGFRLKPFWHHMTLVRNYSPRFLKDYKNPEQRSAVSGIYFAGNYLTHPLITSTGSAIASGQRAASYIIEDYEK